MCIFSSSVVVGIIVVLASLVLAFYKYQTRYFSHWKDRNVPYAETHWIFGSLKDVINKKISWHDFASSCYASFKDTGIGGIFLFRYPALIICDTDLIEKILVHDFVHFQDRSSLKRNEKLMQSLYMAKGERWKMMRYKLNTAFSSAKVRAMMEQIINCGDMITRRIDASLETSDSVQIEPSVFEYTTEVIASCTVGVQLLADREIGDKFKHAFKVMSNTSPYRIIKFFFMTLFPKCSTILGMKIVEESISDFFTNLTLATINYRESKNIKRNDFLQMLLDLKSEDEKVLCNSTGETNDEDYEDTVTSSPIQPPTTLESGDCSNLFSNDVIVSLVWNLIASGLNPCASTINFAMFEISRNETIQRKAQSEIECVLKKHTHLSFEAVKEMAYLDQIIQETMRLHSFNSLLVRCVTEPYKIPKFDFTLDKDTLVYVPISVLHMDPDRYPSPEQFNPDRFEGNNYKANSFFMPFGNGPRICISIRFALVLIKVCLVKVLLNYDMKLANKMKLPVEYDINEFYPKAKEGTWLTFKKRQHE